jgi:hypothetical protein
MADPSTRPEAVDVEHIMQQIRARIRERRGADYSDAELQQLAGAKLDQLLDALGGRARLFEQAMQARTPAADLPSYEFEDSTIFATHRGFLSAIRRLLRPVLKLFFNPDPLSRALHIQSRLNTEFQQRFRRREELDPLYAELLRGVVVELTRAGLEVQSLKLRLESVATRLDFDQRRGQPREVAAPSRPAPARPTVRVETPGEPPASENRPAPDGSVEPGSERRRRRRRRRRRGGAGAIRALPGSPPLGGAESGPADAVVESLESGETHEDPFDEAPDDERGADSDES